MRLLIKIHSTATILFLMALSANLEAQDAQYSQFYANPLYINPAFAGSNVCPRLTLNYRNQWPGLPQGSFATYNASYDQYVDFMQGGVGVLVNSDNAGNGTINTLNASLMYAYTLPLSRDISLKFGAQVTYWQKSLDWDRLTFGDMIDPRYGFIYNTQETEGSRSVNNIDFSVGTILYSEAFYVGFAVHHLAEPKESFFSNDDAVLYRKYTVHAGGVIPLVRGDLEAGMISPNVLFMSQGPASQINVGLYGQKSVFVVGLWYRMTDIISNEFSVQSDAIIVLVGIEYEKFKLGYSYDITVSRLNKTGGAHEISLGYKFNCKVRRKKNRPLVCPQF